jgi:hypothetical protein
MTWLQTQQHRYTVFCNIQPINSRLWGKEHVIVSIGHLHLQPSFPFVEHEAEIGEKSG